MLSSKSNKELALLVLIYIVYIDPPPNKSSKSFVDDFI